MGGRGVESGVGGGASGSAIPTILPSAPNGGLSFPFTASISRATAVAGTGPGAGVGAGTCFRNTPFVWEGRYVLLRVAESMRKG